jgi:hypothetical protein
MAEKYCVQCEMEIDYEEWLEESIKVNGSYLCNTYCLVDHLKTHGLVGLEV